MTTTAIPRPQHAAPPPRTRASAGPSANARAPPGCSCPRGSSARACSPLLPMAVSLYLSFTDYDLFDPPHWVGLRNYTQMFTEDPRYWRSVTTTLMYVVVAVPLKLALALGVALLLKSHETRHGLLPVRVLRALAARRVACPSPSSGGRCSTTAAPCDNLGSAPAAGSTTRLGAAGRRPADGVAVRRADGHLPGRAEADPAELYEAAAVDGAGQWRQFRSVTLPMLSPVIFFNLVLETIHAFQVFTQAFVVSGGTGGPADSTLFYTLYLYERGFTDLRHGLRLRDGLGAAARHRRRHRGAASAPRSSGCSTATRGGPMTPINCRRPASRVAGAASPCTCCCLAALLVMLYPLALDGRQLAQARRRDHRAASTCCPSHLDVVELHDRLDGVNDVSVSAAACATRC